MLTFSRRVRIFTISVGRVFGLGGLVWSCYPASPPTYRGRVGELRPRYVPGKSWIIHIKDRPGSYTVNAWLLLTLVARSGVGCFWTSWLGGNLASCRSLPSPNPCADVCDDLRRATWGIKRSRDAGALEMGGRTGLRLNEAFFLTPRC